MTKLIHSIFSLIQEIFFHRIGTTWRASSFKRIMDIEFSIFEKVAVHFNILAELYINSYDEIISTEIQQTGITKNDNVLVIGCGSIPVTAILIHQKTQSKITTIDIDIKSVNNAQKYLNRTNLQNNIKIHLADGLSFPLSGFTIIFMLYGIHQPQQLLQRLAQDLPPDTKLILRITTDTSGKPLGGKIKIPPNLILTQHNQTTSLGAVDSYLYTKKL